MLHSILMQTVKFLYENTKVAIDLGNYRYYEMYIKHQQKTDTRVWIIVNFIQYLYKRRICINLYLYKYEKMEDPVKSGKFLTDNVSVNCLLFTDDLITLRALFSLSKLYVEFKQKIFVSKTNIMGLKMKELIRSKVMIENKVKGTNKRQRRYLYTASNLRCYRWCKPAN